MNFVALCRIFALALTYLFTLMSVLTSVIALVTPHWQTVTITEFHTEHRHGLWMDCIVGKKHVQDWHKAVLCLILLAQLAAFFACCFLMCALCFRIASLVSCALLLIATTLSSVGAATFFIYSHKVEFRFVQGITRTYEQKCGYSFYLALSSCVTFLFAFLCSVFCTVMVFLNARNRWRQPKNYPHINSAV